MQQDNELVPYPERVAANFKAWLAQQASLPLPSGERAGVRGFSVRVNSLPHGTPSP
jgi:type I restriction enzyme R subunit